MNFMRPSVRKLLTHWIEVIIVFFGTLLFGYLALVSIGRILPFVYGAITLALFFLMLVAIRRVRLSSEVDIKSGFVEVDERQITYFSLGQSWSISLDDLVLVEAEVVVKESIYFYWVISDIYGSVIRIPASVKGNENLLDAISSLEGVLFDQISNSMNIDSPGRKIIWQKKF